VPAVSQATSIPPCYGTFLNKSFGALSSSLYRGKTFLKSGGVLSK